KTLGIDVEKGKLTLPVIHFMATAPHEHKELLRSLLRGGDADKAEKIRNLILPSHAIDYARSKARELIDGARSAIAALRPTEARRTLDSMAEFVLTRPM